MMFTNFAISWPQGPKLVSTFKKYDLWYFQLWYSWGHGVKQNIHQLIVTIVSICIQMEGIAMPYHRYLLGVTKCTQSHGPGPTLREFLRSRAWCLASDGGFRWEETVLQIQGVAPPSYIQVGFINPSNYRYKLYHRP